MRSEQCSDLPVHASLFSEIRFCVMSLIIGTAGWSIPAKDSSSFPQGGSNLQRYAARFWGVEVNSSFHRPHRRSTWERWAASVPADFRFAVKIPKTITHQRKLRDCNELLDEFLDQAGGLGPKLAVLLVQLPPKLSFDPSVASEFFSALSSRTMARLACEPRHLSWFEDYAEHMLRELSVTRVAADPALTPAAASPGGWPGLRYWRLHGSPVMYRSAYGPDRLSAYYRLIQERLMADEEVWCMFDNTASSAAAHDALLLSAQFSS
jgi:uncharacterized protein YecE (DUF72 family)